MITKRASVLLPKKGTIGTLRCCLDSMISQMNKNIGFLSEMVYDPKEYRLTAVLSDNAEGNFKQDIQMSEGVLTATVPTGMEAPLFCRHLSNISHALAHVEMNNRGIEIETVEVTDVLTVEFHGKVNGNLKPFPPSLKMHEENKAATIENCGTERLLLIDGNNLLNRQFYGTAYGKADSELMQTSSGVYTNAIKPTFQKLFSMIEQFEPTHLAFCMDIPREETFRRRLYPDYKGTRGERPLPLLQQFQTLTDILDKVGIPYFRFSPYEADDIAGSLAARWKAEQKGTCYIYSNDKDLLQLLNDTTHVIVTQKGEELYSLEHFQNDYTLSSRQWIDVKAIQGDTSDNIPGIHGVGSKTAIDLIRTYGSVESMLEQTDSLDKRFNRFLKKIVAGKDSAILSKKLATIVTDMQECRDINWNKIKLKIDQSVLKQELENLEIDWDKEIL